MRTPDKAAAPLLDAAKTENLQITALKLDVTDDESVRAAVDRVVADAGQIDVVVNNAGLGDLGALELASDDVMRSMFETNVFGPARVARSVLPSMRARGSGTIVSISSVAGLVVGAGNGLYAATKHALEAMSEAMALEVLQFGIRVAIIEPGFFATPIIDKAMVSVPGAAGDGPYANVERRMAGIYMGGKAAAQDPQLVAETIEHAITTDVPKLRYRVGVDAEVFATRRPAMSDEEYLETFGRAQTDDEFFASFMRVFPMPTA
jgi:NAD(P)-dependent dehydrogenase (short-subunit alcohol dehydrogenase family)